MKKIIVLVILLGASGAIVFAASSSTNHQVQLNVPEIALIGLNDGATVTLNVVQPLAAGDPPTGESNASKILYYTAVNTTGTHRNIDVQWGVGDAAPAGTSLQVAVTSVTGISGDCGTAGAAVTISSTAQHMVTGIPSCYTGIGGGNGAAMTYTLQVDSAKDLVVGDNHLVTVTLTLTDGS